MNFLIFGLGAIGTVFSVSLKKAGHVVYGITKEKYFKQIKEKPIRIRGLFGEKTVNLDGIYINPKELAGKNIDLVIVSVKSYDTKEAISELEPILNEKTLVLLAQNGYGNYEIATYLLNKKKVILSRIIFGAKLIETGFAEVTVFADDIIIGQPEKAISEEKLNEIGEIFNQAGLPTRVSNDVYTILWDKILYNSALNPLGALLGCTYGMLAEYEETREIMNQIIREIFDITKAKGIKLNWRGHEEFQRYFYEKLVPPTARHFPSMLSLIHI